MMGWVECDKKGEVGEILYRRSVVGDNTYYIDTKMGGRTHSGMIHLKWTV